MVIFAPEYALEHAPALIIVVPLLLAVVAALCPPRLGWGLALLATATSAVVALLQMRLTMAQSTDYRASYHLGGWAPPWGIEFAVDHATALVVLVIAAMGFVATISSKRLFLHEVDSSNYNRVYGAWLLAFAGLLGLVMTADAFNLFVFFEISSLASVTLVAMGSGVDKRALVAAFNYLLIGAIGAIFYVIGVGFCYAMTGTLNMLDLGARLPQVASQVPVYIGFGFMITGVMVKAAVFPMHFWLAPSYGYAPMAVTVLLASVATKAALYVLIRIFMTIFGGIAVLPQLILEWALIPLALMAVLLGTILAIYERDVKVMLAQSSVAQIGYIVLGFGVGTLAGIQAGFVHIVNHAMIKGGMFIGLGGLVLAMAGQTRIDRLAGLGWRMPITASAFLICGLSLIGVPLTAGFISKFYLVSAVISAGYWPIAGLVLLSSALSVIYLWRLVEVMWFAPPEESVKKSNAKSNAARLPESAMIYVPLWMLALANLWFGIDAGLVVDLSYAAAAALMGAG